MAKETEQELKDLKNWNSILFGILVLLLVFMCIGMHHYRELHGNYYKATEELQNLKEKQKYDNRQLETGP
jgi:hypothetical protein